MTIRVVEPGLLTTVQDRGRWGHQALGVPVAGPMDGVSHRLANLLVGNQPDCATLEVTLAGPTLEFLAETAFAVAIGTAITVAVTWAALLGCVVPLVCRRVGIDPAVVAGPLLITVSDISGTVLYLGVAHILLSA